MRHWRLSLVGAFAGLVGLATAPAHADNFEHLQKGLTVDGFLGAHIFSDNNEIGQFDIATADSPQHSFAFGVRLGYALNWVFSIEGEASFMPTTADAGDANLFAVGWRAHALFHVLPGRIQPFFLVGAGALSLLSSDDDQFDEDTDAMFHGGAGVRYWIKDSWGARADARVLFPPSSDDDFATADWEFTVGMFKYFGHKEEPKRAPVDTDGDGLTDDIDKCPQEPEDMDNFQDDDGCPDNDNDNDGILDANDKCPDTPEDKNGIDDEDGCPEEDTDGDGLVGSQDQCPTEPEDKDGFQDEDGCPDADNDGDGIADTEDKCPMEPETVNQYQDEDGCPDEVPKEVEKFSGAIEGIKFKLGSAEIRRSSNKILDEAVAVLQKYPDIKLEIQGHTDTTGSDERNRTLSDARANAVMQYLISKGVDESRLTAKGYGPDKPVADNETKAGRAQNRRVEFVRQ